MTLRIKSTFRILLNYCMVFVIFSLIYILLFRVGTFSEWILFYRGLALLALTSVLSLALFFWIAAKTRRLSFETGIAGVICSACLHLAFFIVVPVTIDRSQTTFLIQLMEKENRELSKDELEELFVKKYIYENNAIGRRIDEQVRSGNFIPSNGGFVLTKQGSGFLEISRLVLKTFGLRSEVVENEL